jgi:hypothetical protein
MLKDGVRKALKDRHNALIDLIRAIRDYRKLADRPLTLQGSEFAHALQELNKAIDRAEALLQNCAKF